MVSGIALHWNALLIFYRFRRSGKRSEIFLATKFGFKDGGMLLDASPESAKESILSSLKRLGLDYIDLYYIHR